MRLRDVVGAGATAGAAILLTGQGIIRWLAEVGRSQLGDALFDRLRDALHGLLPPWNVLAAVALVVVAVWVWWPQIAERWSHLWPISVIRPIRMRISGPAFDEVAPDDLATHRPQEFVFLVRLTNTSGGALKDCQLFFVLGDNPYPVSPSFDMRQGDIRDLVFMRAQLAVVPGARAYVDIATKEGKKSDLGIIVSPGIHRLRVVSSDCRPVTIRMRVLTVEPSSFQLCGYAVEPA